jgi:hypothetical protein
VKMPLHMNGHILVLSCAVKLKTVNSARISGGSKCDNYDSYDESSASQYH